MPKFFVPKPLEVFEYKKDNEKIKDELATFGIVFTDEGNRVIGPGGNPLDIEDGDYVVLEPDGSLRRYGKTYLETNYIEHGQAPKHAVPPVKVEKKPLPAPQAPAQSQSSPTSDKKGPVDSTQATSKK